MTLAVVTVVVLDPAAIGGWLVGLMPFAGSRTVFPLGIGYGVAAVAGVVLLIIAPGRL